MKDEGSNILVYTGTPPNGAYRLTLFFFAAFATFFLEVFLLAFFFAAFVDFVFAVFFFGVLFLATAFFAAGFFFAGSPAASSPPAAALAAQVEVGFSKNITRRLLLSVPVLK